MCAAYDSKIGQNVAIYVLNDITSLVLLWWLIGSITFWLEFIAMKTIFLFTVVCLLHCKGAVVTRRLEWAVNDRPIVGILSQEQSVYLQTKFPQQNYTSYIAASYVKDVESSGARVVPIMIGKDRSYYEDIMSKINGVLFPGGGTYFNQSNGYADAGQHIYEIAQQLNDQGDYFPIFGTCLGFELLIILASGRGKDENRIKCYYFRNLPLEFVDGFRSSKMFEKVPEDIVQLLANEEITVNAHQFCIVDENLKSHNLTKDWRVTSHSKDEQGVKFIASVENKKYPFYGVQFHPEKVPFEWKLKKNYPHSAEAIKANRYFMDFFVNECRKNLHSFASAAEENQYLIYNYSPVFTGALGSAFDQCYFFEPRGTDNEKNYKDYAYKVL